MSKPVCTSILDIDPRRVLCLYSGSDAPTYEVWLVSQGSPPGRWTVAEASPAEADRIRDERQADWAEWVKPEGELAALREQVWTSQLGRGAK